MPSALYCCQCHIGVTTYSDWNMQLVRKLMGGEVVRKVKHSSERIENPLLALYGGTEYFSLARTFRTAWGSIDNFCFVLVEMFL